MTAAEFFAAAAALPVGDLDDLAPRGGLVVVAPHPDDESLGCGGLIAEACRRGRPVRLVVVSDGTGSHPSSAAYPPERLRALREAETAAAAAELGLDAACIRFLRLPDRFVPTDGPQADAAVDAIADAARDCAAGAILVTWRHDPHCDHEAAHALAAQAAARLGVPLFAYPVWGWTLPADHAVGAAPAGWRLDVAAHRDAKRRAIAAHRSQVSAMIDDDPGGFRLPDAMVARMLGDHETFLRAGAP